LVRFEFIVVVVMLLFISSFRIAEKLSNPFSVSFDASGGFHLDGM
jgi:hypothetical protein